MSKWDLMVTHSTGRVLLYRPSEDHSWRQVARFDSYTDADYVLQLLRETDYQPNE